MIKMNIPTPIKYIATVAKVIYLTSCGQMDDGQKTKKIDYTPENIILSDDLKERIVNGEDKKSVIKELDSILCGYDTIGRGCKVNTLRNVVVQRVDSAYKSP